MANAKRGIGTTTTVSKIYSLIRKRNSYLTMSSPLPVARLGALCLALTGSVSAHAAAPAAGEVVLVAGPAFVQTEAGRTPLARGAALKAGQTLFTGEGGFVHVRMADGGMVAVRPLSEFHIDVFDYQGDVATDRVRYQLREGVARSVTGGVGEVNKDAFRLNTPVAAVGVRGTDFVVATDNARSRVAVNSGAVVVAALGSGCAADAFGACTSGGLLLGAAPSADGRYVEVAVGNPSPRLVQDPATSPDSTAVPHPQEPVASVRAGTSESVNRSKPDTVLELPATPAPAPAPDPAAPSPGQPGVSLPPVQPEIPPVAVTMPTDAYWGRWDAIGKAGNDEVLLASQLRAAGKAAQLANTVYVAGLESRATDLPRTGRADFLAAGGEGMLISPTGNTTLAVGAGTLSVDFNQRSFDTRSSFEGNGATYATSASGVINERGFLHSDPARSDSLVTGAIGKNLDSAVTTVQRTFEDGQLHGVVIWGQR